MRRFFLLLALFLALLIPAESFAGPFMVLPKRGSAWTDTGPSGYGSDLFAWTSEYATASDSYANQDPWNALDDSVSGSSYWMPANTSGTKWWQYQFSAGKRLEKVTIQAHSIYNNAPTDWTLQASNTGAYGGEQVTLHTVSGDTEWSTSQEKEFTFTNANSYTYYRFVITDWKKGGAGGDYLVVGEFEGMEGVY